LKVSDEKTYIALFRAVMFVHQDLQGLARKVGARYGLLSAELNVVDILGRFGTTTMGELARRTFISPANTTRTVKNLEARKLVARSRDGNSDRVVIVALTPKGRALFRKCFPAIFNEAVRYFDKGLSKQERDQLAELLERFVPPMHFFLAPRKARARAHATRR
jgi:DNA-binding MarR family transcriptional regulator